MSTPPLPERLMTEFSFTVLTVKAGIRIDLIRSKDGAIKVFFLAESVDVVGRSLAVTRHMETLTDGQCESFFPDARTKGEKKAKAKVASE